MHINRLPSLRSLLTPLASQQGFGQLAVIALLLIGVAITTVVVQNRTNLIPHAAENVEPGDCEGGYTFKGGDAGDDNSWEYTGCGQDQEKTNTEESKDNSCGYDQQSKEYSCEDGYRCYEDFFKDESTGCNWQYKDPHYHCDKDDKCEDSNIQLKENSDNSESDCQKAGGEWRDNRCFTTSVSRGGTSEPGNQSTSTPSQYDPADCRDGAQTYKDGYAWIAYCNISCTKNSDCDPNTTDGAVDPKTSNWCYGFNGGQVPRCMKLVQTDNKEVGDPKRKEDNSKAVATIKQTLAQGGNSNPTASQEARQSSSTELRAKVNAQSAQRNDLTGEMATVINKSGGSNSTINAAISRAQNLITEAAAKATSCYTGHDKPLSDACDAEAQAANDIAVAASRVALFDAVAAGVPETCVKVDMAVGSNSSNSLIEVTPTSGGAASRLFMCRGRESSIGAKDGVIIWQVRDEQGKLQNVSQSSLDKLNLKTGQTSLSAIPEDLITRRNNAAKLANQPAYSASAVTSSSATEWKEVGVINCHNNCSSFPSGGVCYQKGNSSVYSCDGKKPTATTTQRTTTPTTTAKKNLPKGDRCEKNSDCKSNQCNPGTSKCI